jgi:hypothetical protein
MGTAAADTGRGQRVKGRGGEAHWRCRRVLAGLDSSARVMIVVMWAGNKAEEGCQPILGD